MSRLLKIGTRGSALALYQTAQVEQKLLEAFRTLQFERVRIRTKGDQLQKGAVASGSTSIFTREIEDALMEGKVDIGVHSAKDLASELPDGLVLGALLAREDARDCLVAADRRTIKTLPTGARIGTSSLRRRAQLKRLRFDLQFTELRGNVDTRVKKIKKGECDGMVLAYAGLKRLQLTEVVTEIFPPETLLPQAGQGAIAVEIRAEDGEVKSLVHTLNHDATFRAVIAERSFLRTLRGGCQLPAGVYASTEGDQLTLRGAIFSLEGDREVSGTESGAVSDAEALGAALGNRLLAAGGSEILNAIRERT